MITENGPFGAGSRLASLSSEDKVRWFLARARRQRQFVLKENTPPADVLAHLNLLDAGQPTHAAVLLFGHRCRPECVNCVAGNYLERTYTLDDSRSMLATPLGERQLEMYPQGHSCPSSASATGRMPVCYPQGGKGNARVVVDHVQQHQLLR